MFMKLFLKDFFGGVFHNFTLTKLRTEFASWGIPCWVSNSWPLEPSAVAACNHEAVLEVLDA